MKVDVMYDQWMLDDKSIYYEFDWVVLASPVQNSPVPTQHKNILIHVMNNNQITPAQKVID